MSDGFRYEDLPVFDAFERVSDPSVFTALPDDWQVGAADVVKSTDALKAGRYKDVNMAGAAVVGAVRNALGSCLFPVRVRRRWRGARGSRRSRSCDARRNGRDTNFVAEELNSTFASA